MFGDLWCTLADRDRMNRLGRAELSARGVSLRYLVTARIKAGREVELLSAIDRGTLGQESVAGGEYLRNMADARLCGDGAARWVEVCFCDEPLAEERPYWEEYFELERIQDARSRRLCRDANGSEPWACCDCDCTDRLEARMKAQGRSFLESLRAAVKGLQP
jgi:hypothetical protein